MTNIHGKIRVLPALDTFEKIVVFQRRVGVKVNFFGADDRVEDFL